MSLHVSQPARRGRPLSTWLKSTDALEWPSMKSSSECPEPHVMPRWLLLAYRFATALAILMLVAAAVTLVVSAVMGIASLWHLDILRSTGLQSLSVHV